MKKLLIAAVAAATVLPSAAMARPAERIVVVDHDRGFAHRGPVEVRRITVGSRVEPGFIARHDVVQHPRRYHLTKTTANTRWLKVRDDAVLVNLRNGRVLDIAYNLFR